MAATTESVTYAAQVAAASNYASVTLDKRGIDSPVKIAAIDIDLTADDVAGTVINAFQLPPGAGVLPTLSSIGRRELPGTWSKGIHRRHDRSRRRAESAESGRHRRFDHGHVDCHVQDRHQHHPGGRTHDDVSGLRLPVT